VVSFFDSLFGFIIELSPKKQHYDEYEQESGAVAHLHAK